MSRSLKIQPLFAEQVQMLSDRISCRETKRDLIGQRPIVISPKKGEFADEEQISKLARHIERNFRRVFSGTEPLVHRACRKTELRKN